MGFQPAARLIVLVVSKSSRNWLVTFTGILCYDLQELLFGGNFCTMTCFVASGLFSEGNVPKIGERMFDFFFLHDNAPTHRSVSVKNFFSKGSMTRLQHPHLAAANIYMFP